MPENKLFSPEQAYLAAIVESSDDAILSKNLDGVIQSCNVAAQRLFGYSASELIGRPVRILIPPERQAEEDDILARIRRGERIDHFETVRITKDGRRVDISLTVSPVRDSSGAIIGASKIAKDITEQKRLATELAYQREWLRVTLGSIGDAVIAADQNGFVTYINTIAEGLTGWTAQTAAGRPLAEVFQIINEKTRQPVVIRQGLIVGLPDHTVLVSRNGTERPINDSAAPIRDAKGRILGVVLVFRDVTEKRRAEEAVAEQREWFQTALESIGDAVIATDMRGRVVFMNPVAEHLTGWGAKDAAGRKCNDVFRIITEHTRRSVANPVTRVLAEGVIVGLASHTVLIAADGTERPIDDSGAPIRNREGRIVGVVLVFRDVTDRRRAEDERRTAAAERERLLEAERIARAEAERASRIKDDFIAMVSHELRTPLNAILGWAELMMRSKNDVSMIERGLDVVSRNTRIQAQLISDLLDISRIVSGKLRLDIASVDLGAVITDAIEIVQQEAMAKGIEIHKHLDVPVGPIAGDAARIQQIIWNLLSNAIKFSSGGGQVRVYLRDADTDAEITVVDTGSGIRPEFLPNVFDRFQQADLSIRRGVGGLGLGLSIVKHLVELHGGRVKAESSGEGKGAKFTIRLPLSLRPGLAETVACSSPTPKEVAAAPSLEGISVMVVEDEPDTREFLTRLLATHGAKVTTAASASEALAQFPSRKPDILVSDIGMPGMDGYELMQRIREGLLAGSSFPAIALTAYARTEDRTRALRAGYQAHLAKPVEPSELIAIIASFTKLLDVQRGTH
jgi:PAS domain S-box-containing protein